MTRAPHAAHQACERVQHRVSLRPPLEGPELHVEDEPRGGRQPLDSQRAAHAICWGPVVHALHGEQNVLTLGLPASGEHLKPPTKLPLAFLRRKQDDELSSFLADDLQTAQCFEFGGVEPVDLELEQPSGVEPSLRDGARQDLVQRVPDHSAVGGRVCRRRSTVTAFGSAWLNRLGTQ